MILKVIRILLQQAGDSFCVTCARELPQPLRNEKEQGKVLWKPNSSRIPQPVGQQGSGSSLQPLSEQEVQMKDWRQRQIFHLDCWMWMLWDGAAAPVSLGLIDTTQQDTDRNGSRKGCRNLGRTNVLKSTRKLKSFLSHPTLFRA